MTIVKNRPVCLALMALGWLWVGIAFIGVAIPGIPTTGPIILAAFLFSKSSERFDHWLVTNRVFGSIVRDWRTGEGFTTKVKTGAVVTIVLSFGITTWFFFTSGYMRGLMWALAAGIAIFVVTRPTKPATCAEIPSPLQGGQIRQSRIRGACEPASPVFQPGTDPT
ncbi:MAG: YbaN family protein [Acidimicrobiia bacterium]|nr:YbaN family protein [Acidimicrobiia bacterium]